MGRYLLNGLLSLRHHRTYWDAWGVGLLAGLELVADRSDGRIFRRPAEFGNAVCRKSQDRRLVTLVLHPGNVLFFAPSLIISRSEIDELVEVLDDALTDVKAHLAMSKHRFGFDVSCFRPNSRKGQAIRQDALATE
jgi:L-2,4-diaminobutyrate transaminase